MKELLRTRVERFGLEDSIRLGEIAQLQKEGILEEKIIAIDEMFPTYAQVVLPRPFLVAVRNGNSFRKRDISQETALKESACTMNRISLLRFTVTAGKTISSRL